MLSCYLIVKNAADTLENTLVSVQGLADEIVLVDDGSTDATVEIAKKYNAHIYTFKNPSEGEKRAYALEQCHGDWVLCLDADEVVSDELSKEIKQVLQNPEFDGYTIPYQNHFLGHVVKHGGENYSVLRLFHKKKSSLEITPIHSFHSVQKAGALKGHILHYSYRSVWQVYSKFTKYAFLEAKRKKVANEKTGLKQVTLYPIHMFWARFIKDKGYKDGIIRIPLDLGFAYMEWLTYVLMFFVKP